MSNPLATPAQIDAEKTTLRIEASPEMRAVREQLRRDMRADSGADSADGYNNLDRALDQWMRDWILRQICADLPDPAFVWLADNSPHTWFGHTYPGSFAAGDNPDNSNRVAFLDGSSSYEMTGRFGPRGMGQFNINIEIEHPCGGMGDYLATLIDRDIQVDADGLFRVTLDSKPADGRKNHLQMPADQKIMLVTRDSRADWTQSPTETEIRRVSGPRRPQVDAAAQLARLVRTVPDYVHYWIKFKDWFLDRPEPNRIVFPRKRVSEGGWGFLAGGRFKLADDEALVITSRDAGANYTGFQVVDPWTLRPENELRTSSLNKTQARTNPDGTYTYVMALQDPGIANWIDTVGLREGWFLMRWQNVPAGGEPWATEPRLVKLADLAKVLPDGVPLADLAYRQAQIRNRVAEYAQRYDETPPAALAR